MYITGKKNLKGIRKVKLMMPYDADCIQSVRRVIVSNGMAQVLQVCRCRNRWILTFKCNLNNEIWQEMTILEYTYCKLTSNK